jgi:hypothetical protein
VRAQKERSIVARLWSLSLPVIGLNVLNVLALAVDTAMCGRLPEHEAALTGLGFATQIVFLLLVAMLGLVVGAAALVSRAHGAGDVERVEHVLFPRGGDLVNAYEPASDAEEPRTLIALAKNLRAFLVAAHDRRRGEHVQPLRL